MNNNNNNHNDYSVKIVVFVVQNFFLVTNFSDTHITHSIHNVYDGHLKHRLFTTTITIVIIIIRRELEIYKLP